MGLDIQTCQDLSRYVERLFELGDGFTRTGVMSSHWHNAKHEASVFANKIGSQLRGLSSQIVRSQRIMLTSGTTEMKKRVFLANRMIQLLLEREEMQRQLKELRSLSSDCGCIVNGIHTIQVMHKSGNMSKGVMARLPIDQLERLKQKYTERKSRIDKQIKWFLGDECLITAKISNDLDELYSEKHKSHRGFGITELPNELDEDVKYAETLTEALELHRKYAIKAISPTEQQIELGESWRMDLAADCMQYKREIDYAEVLIGRNCDAADTRIFVEALMETM